MKKHLITVLNYFSFFSYTPSLSEIHTFFPVLIQKQRLQQLLSSLIHKKILLSYSSRFLTSDNRPLTSFYTLPQYSTSVESLKLKVKNSRKKRLRNTGRLLRRAKPYIQLLKVIPFVQMVGITGSASMNNCKENDDIDLCIITQPKTLWLTRFICVNIAKIMRVYGNTVCINLFFDSSDLVIPKQKQTLYVGHELMQMNVIINKNQTYERMLKENKWVQNMFPNIQKYIQYSVFNVRWNKTKPNLLLYTYYFILNTIENFLKIVQLTIIHHNKTGLIITPTQLWLFKHDFEAYLKQKMKMI